MTALVFAALILGVSGIGALMWLRMRRDQAAPQTDDASQPVTRGGRRRHEN